MNTHRSISVLVFLVFCFWSGFEAKAGLHDGLANKLRTHSFNLYSAPFLANDMVLRDMKGRVVSLSEAKGKVVLLNFWRIDCPPFTEFLESLLEELPMHAAHKEGLFEAVAKQGTVPASGNEPPIAALYAQAAPGVTSDRTVAAEQPSLKLPFQAPASPDIARDKAAPPPLTPGKEGTKQIGEAATRDKKPKETGRGSQTKQSPTLQTSSPQGKQQPLQGKKKGSDDSRSTAPVGVKQVPPETTPLDPYGLSSLLPSGSSATTGARALPPLPPALPYTPPRSAEPFANRSILPDQTGGVMARIPSSVGTSPPSSTSVPGRQGQTAGLPSARPLGMQNPIDGFILDSFGRGGNLQPALIRPEPTVSPSPSMLGQIKHDIKQLGIGVKETFSRFLPGF